MSISRGASPRPIQDFLSSTGMPWLKISDATETNSNFITTTKEYIVEKGIVHSRIVIPDTLIVSNSATPALSKIMKITACIHDGWLILNKYNNFSKELTKYIVDYNKQKLISSGNGSVFTNLKTEILKSLIVKVPNKDDLAIITKILSLNLNKQYKLELENIKLNNLKQLYLKKFFG